MAMSLSADDEDYDSEAEQVSAPLDPTPQATGHHRGMFVSARVD